LYVVMVVSDGLRSTLIRSMEYLEEVMSSGGAPTPASTLFCTHMKREIKNNGDMGMGHLCLWLNGWGIYGLMGGAFMA